MVPARDGAGRLSGELCAYYSLRGTVTLQANNMSNYLCDVTWSYSLQKIPFPKCISSKFFITIM
jgi:hypothetical protein